MREAEEQKNPLEKENEAAPDDIKNIEDEELNEVNSDDGIS